MNTDRPTIRAPFVSIAPAEPFRRAPPLPPTDDLPTVRPARNVQKDPDMNTKTEQKIEAGKQTALADFRAGRMHAPAAADLAPWAHGYRLAVADLAATFGGAAVRAAGYPWGSP